MRHKGRSERWGVQEELLPLLLALKIEKGCQEPGSMGSLWEMRMTMANSPPGNRPQSYNPTELKSVKNPNDSGSDSPPKTPVRNVAQPTPLLQPSVTLSRARGTSDLWTWDCKCVLFEAAMIWVICYINNKKLIQWQSLSLLLWKDLILWVAAFAFDMNSKIVKDWKVDYENLAEKYIPLAPQVPLSFYSTLIVPKLEIEGNISMNMVYAGKTTQDSIDPY